MAYMKPNELQAGACAQLVAGHSDSQDGAGRRGARTSCRTTSVCVCVCLCVDFLRVSFLLVVFVSCSFRLIFVAVKITENEIWAEHAPIQLW